MENKVLEKNLNSINQYNKTLTYELLMEKSQKANIEIVQTQSNEYNLIYNNIPIHNQISAIQEAKELIANIQDDENTIRVIYGLGLGYLVDVFSEKIKKSKIVVYEPNIDILHFVLEIAEIDALYQKNVFIFHDSELLYDFIQNNSNEKTNATISFLGSYKQLFYDDIKNTLNIIQKAQGMKIAEKNTILKRGISTNTQTFLNLASIFSRPNISSLKNIYKDKTALILGAGQSLKDNIEIIKKNQKNVIIFAVNQACRTLKENGIKPDFIINIDPVDNLYQFNGIDTENYYFILESYANPEVSKFKTKKTFNYISNNNVLNVWLRDILNIHDNLQSEGTVSYNAIRSALLMGFNKIILCGQDLAYKNGTIYAQGCGAGNLECKFDEKEKKYIITTQNIEELIKSTQNPTESYEACKARLLAYIDRLNTNIHTVLSQTGDYLPTQGAYVFFIKMFENLSKEYKKQFPNLQFINSSTGGALIPEFENLTLDEALKNEKEIERLDLTKYENEYDKKYASDRITQMKQEFETIEKLFSNFKEVNSKTIKELNIKKIYTSNAIKLIKKHKELLDKIIAMQKKEVIGYVITCWLFKYENILNSNYLNDAINTKNELTKLNELVEETIWNFKHIINGLADCQSVIFK